MSFEIPVDDALTLRLIDPEYAEDIYAVVDANREHISRWLPWVEITRCADDTRNFAARQIESHAKGLSCSMTVFEHDKVVGGCGWNAVAPNATLPNIQTDVADIGYWLVANAVGRGIITRCARALIDHTFNNTEIFRITIRAEPDNERSWAVPERLGFVREGTMRHICRWNGRWVDHHLYAMLREDWLEKQS